MPENMRIAVEIGFNILYLITVWGLVIAMFARASRVAAEDQKIAGRIRWMFFLLALGDTGHVGFRVIAYAHGGLEQNPLLVGLGALATAITVTFFYMLLVDVWRMRYQKPIGWIGWILLAAGVIRLIVMILPANEWGSVVPPEPMGVIRNLFLMVQGLGVMALIFIDAGKKNDRLFKAIGWCVFWSYLFYTPVILFVRQVPMLGMLMIPKTLAYVAIAVIAYRALYQPATKAN